MSQQEEVWENLHFTNWYSVSSFWRVMNRKWKILKNTTNWTYERVCISIWTSRIIKSYFIHRLVWYAFLWLDINDKMSLVCHKDDNPFNNNLSNLFIWTHKDNSQDCIKKWRNSRWDMHPISTITNDQAILVKCLLNRWLNKTQISVETWINKCVISTIKQWISRWSVTWIINKKNYKLEVKREVSELYRLWELSDAQDRLQISKKVIELRRSIK